MVKLVSCDGKEHEISKDIASQSVLIKNMLDDVGEEHDQAIPLPNVSGIILSKGIIYLLINASH
jgi:S-phase kinase-associated protein 1